MRHEKFNFWPLGITFYVVVVVGLIIWTLYFALSNPVQREDSFLVTYQDADASINQIQQDQKEFLQNYDLVWIEGETLGKHGAISEHSRGQDVVSILKGLSFPAFEFSIIPKEHAKPFIMLDIKAVLTRPHTKVFDQDLSFVQNGDKYQSEPVELPAYGRWVIQGVIEYHVADNADKKKAYFKYEFFAKEI